MSDIHGGNWAFQDPGDAIPDDSTIVDGNFSQKLPDTPIMVGKSLTIVDGNWVNVRQDAAWIVQGGNWSQNSYCYHLHPKWDLPEEIVNCPHVIEIHNVTIDGQIVHTEYEREDMGVT